MNRCIGAVRGCAATVGGEVGEASTLVACMILASAVTLRVSKLFQSWSCQAGTDWPLTGVRPGKSLGHTAASVVPSRASQSIAPSWSCSSMTARRSLRVQFTNAG